MIIYVPHLAVRFGQTVRDYWLQCERNWLSGTRKAMGFSDVICREEAAYCCGMAKRAK